MQNIFVEFLPPWIETGLQPAFYDKESGTVLQQVARMYAKVNYLVKMFNKFSKDTTEFVNDFVDSTTKTVNDYIEKFTQLKDFVDDYFDNLDVQEEINNKLDEMAADGTLQEMIATYLQSNVVWTFDTVADMQAATNLTDGSYAQTLGYYTVNDGGGSLYYITDSLSSTQLQVTLPNSLYASFIGNEIKAAQIGMIPNDSTEAIDNFTKLVGAINLNYTIIIDNIYYIDTVSMAELTADTLNIKGVDKSCGFKFNPSADTRFLLINSCNEVNVSNLYFENEGSYLATFLRLTNEALWHINNFNFSDCVVEEKVQIVAGGYSGDVQPILGTHGFNFVTIKNNRFHNLTGFSCFNLFNTIAEKIEIKNNYVHNFTNKFFGLTIDNTSLYQSETSMNIVRTEIDNNYVICDVDYTEESVDATYYCFILLEGNECVYTNNHVEGMKALNNIALYDTYLSVNTLYSFNNIFKNNLLFVTGDNTNCILLKSKGGQTESSDLKRFYGNNTYIIEEDWQKLFDPNLNCQIGFMDLIHPASNYEITNCYFDVPYLRGRQSGYPVDFGRLVVKDNYIHFKKGGTDRFLFAARTQNQDEELIIQGNTIINDDFTTTLLGAFNDTTGEITYYNIDKVSIENNKFKGCDIINRCNINDLKICNNEFELSRKTNASRTIYDSDTQSLTLTFKNNIIKHGASIENFLLRMPTGDNVVDIDNTIYARLSDTSGQGFILSPTIDTENVYRYFFEYEIQHTTGKQKINFYVDYGTDETGTYVKATDSNNNPVTLYSNSSTTSIKVNNETAVTTSTARILINSLGFQIIPQIKYSIANTPTFVRQTVKSVKLS